MSGKPITDREFNRFVDQMGEEHKDNQKKFDNIIDRIDKAGERFNDKIDDAFRTLDAKIDDLSRDVNDRVDLIEHDIATRSAEDWRERKLDDEKKQKDLNVQRQKDLDDQSAKNDANEKDHRNFLVWLVVITVIVGGSTGGMYILTHFFGF